MRADSVDAPCEKVTGRGAAGVTGGSGPGFLEKEGWRMKWVFHRWKAALAAILCLTNCSWSESPTEPERATVRGIVSAAGVPVPGIRVAVMIRLPLQRIENYETFANA